MNYGEYIITTFLDGDRYKARIVRLDGRRFGIKDSNLEFMLKESAETAFSYATEEEAVTEAKAIADSAQT
jgi:hypothetical protein